MRRPPRTQWFSLTLVFVFLGLMAALVLRTCSGAG
jgi:hypothetical protein